MVEERIPRLREVGMLKCICYVKLKPPANDSPRKAYVHHSSVAWAGFRRSSSTEKLGCLQPRANSGRDAVKKLGSLMNLRRARSQNNISQVPVLKFQEYCGHNCCKELWDWSGIQRVSTGSRLIEHGVPGYMIDGLPTRVLLNLYS